MATVTSVPTLKPEPSARRWLWAVAYAPVVVAGIGLRFWQLGSSAWQYDEIIYAVVARSVATGHGLVEKYPVGLPHQPFLYQPPWYPYLLAAWFRATGPSIMNARVLGVLLSGCTLVLLWDLIRRQLGPRAALFAILPLTFDGWLLYIQRDVLHREPDHGGHRGRARPLPAGARLADLAAVRGGRCGLGARGLPEVHRPVCGRGSRAVVANPPAPEPRPRNHGRFRARCYRCRPDCAARMVGAFLPFSDGTPVDPRSGYSAFRRYSHVSGCPDSSPIPAVSRLHSQFPDSARGDKYRGPLHVQVLPATGLDTGAASGTIVQLGGHGDSDLRPV